jgi:hypothetical protein
MNSLKLTESSPLASKIEITLFTRGLTANSGIIKNSSLVIQPFPSLSSFLNRLYNRLISFWVTIFMSKRIDHITYSLYPFASPRFLRGAGCWYSCPLLMMLTMCVCWLVAKVGLLQVDKPYHLLQL